MTMIPPISGVQVGAASGGGLIDTFKGMVGGAGASGGAPTQTAPKDDGSVGLFDGVLKKALIGGAAGAAIGFIPFIPGGPVLGGILGALGGAAMGLFGNYTKMQKIKQENAAMIAAMGVQTNDPRVQQALLSGDAQTLMALQQQAMAGQAGAGVVQQGGAGVVQQGGGVGGTPTQLGAPGQLSQAEAQVVQQASTPATAATGGLTFTYGGGGEAEPQANAGPLMPDDIGAAAKEAEGVDTQRSTGPAAAPPPAVDPGTSSSAPASVPPTNGPGTPTSADLARQIERMQVEIAKLQQILQNLRHEQDRIASDQLAA